MLIARGIIFRICRIIFSTLWLVSYHLHRTSFFCSTNTNSQLLRQCHPNPIGPLSHTTACFSPISSAIQRAQLAYWTSTPPPPEQQQHMQLPGFRILRTSFNMDLYRSFASGPSLKIGLVGPGVSLPRAFSHIDMKSPLLLL